MTTQLMSVFSSDAKVDEPIRQRGIVKPLALSPKVRTDNFLTRIEQECFSPVYRRDRLSEILDATSENISIEHPSDCDPDSAS